jgi:ABC-type sugar transport system ATPase subunit
LGITILLVTHDPNEAIALADRIGVLGDGRLLQTGKPEEVLARPSNRTVAFCFGCPPINLIDGKVEQDTNSKLFVAANGSCRIPLPESISRGALVTLGIRPEDLRPQRRDNGVLLGRGTVIGSQPFAGYWLTDVQLGAGSVRTIGPSQATGEQLDLWVDPSKMHYFDGVDGRRIS